MGYTTEFAGNFRVSPPLNVEEIAYLNAFCGSRRMERAQGPYYVGEDEGGVANICQPPKGQPGPWCQWMPTDNGECIIWDGEQNFYEATEWIKYLINHFLKSGATAVGAIPSLKGGHVLDGEIEVQGMDVDDRWMIVIKNNEVSERMGHWVWDSVEG